MTEAIIPMSADWVEQCTDLYIKIFNAKPWNENWSRENTIEMLNDLCHAPRFKGFLFLLNNDVIGFVAGFSKAHGQGTAFFLAEFCIDGELQGKGYGSRLLACLEEKLRQENVNSLFLLTSSGGVAERFYKKRGFEIKPNRLVLNKIL